MRSLLCSALLLGLLSSPSRANEPPPKRPIHIPRAEGVLPGTRSSSSLSPQPDRPGDGGLIKLGYVNGVIKGDIADGVMNLTVTVSYLEPNPQVQAKYVREYQQVLARQQAILMSRNPRQMQQQLTQLSRQVQQMQRDQQKLFQVKEKQVEVAAQLAEDVKVRVMELPEEFDDKGNIKEYTPEERQKLRGKEGLPGYPANRTSIQNGQSVQVLLARKKETVLATRGKKGEKGPAVEPSKPLALVVVILPRK